MRKVHFQNEHKPYIASICKCSGHGKLYVTFVRKEVTCGNCIKMLNR